MYVQSDEILIRHWCNARILLVKCRGSRIDLHIYTVTIFLSQISTGTNLCRQRFAMLFSVNP